MLRYQASVYGEPVEAEGSGYHQDYPQSSSPAASMVPMTSSTTSNGFRQQQSRIIKRHVPMPYKSLASSRFIPRRRFYVEGQQQQQRCMTTSSTSSATSNGVMFPTPDYLRRMKENYETGKVIYIRRNIPGVKSTTPQPSSVLPNSIRSSSYSTANNSRYVLRLSPKNDFMHEENKQRQEMFVPTIDASCSPFPTVPASMSMGEYEEEEEVESLAPSNETGDDVKLEPDSPGAEDTLFNALGGFLSNPSSELSSPQSPSSPTSLLDNLTTLSSALQSSTHGFNVMTYRTKSVLNKYSCPQSDCIWRGQSEGALRRHISAHEQKNEDAGLVKADPMKVTLVPPKPKGVKCSECDSFAYSRPLLLRHMSDVHGIEAPLIRKTFVNREMLQKWLDTLRETHAVEFVVSSGSKKWGRGLQVHYLTCSRSGDQKERPNKKYVRPPRPSIKCGRNCMAYLKIKQNPTVSELQIEGCLHHSGHDIDHTRIILEHNELESIGALLDAVNDGLEINVENIDVIRRYLGSSGRFRLMSDRGIIEQMPVWIEQYHATESVTENVVLPMYRGSGPLHVTTRTTVLAPKVRPLAMTSRRAVPYSKTIATHNSSGNPILSTSQLLTPSYKREKLTIRYMDPSRSEPPRKKLISPLDIHLSDTTQASKLDAEDDEGVSAVEALFKEEQALASKQMPMIGGVSVDVMASEDVSGLGDVGLGLSDDYQQYNNSDDFIEIFSYNSFTDYNDRGSINCS
ncbi:unnamed protein product [Caenorhabditis auriculariae]|uniref:C2H2-type domain-containing protein n=1 Tax=Caenorhabditis auriculariae TaxID=2777116 RepID=A0A8S1HSU1_9PELO|nr:unnamed protein product [Caenorhabditis auriculariae]